jgi:hypothetical protein
MPNADDIRWFKEQFHTESEAALRGTPFSLDMLTALACQETGSIWPILRKRDLSVPGNGAGDSVVNELIVCISKLRVEAESRFFSHSSGNCQVEYRGKPGWFRSEESARDRFLATLLPKWRCMQRH